MSFQVQVWKGALVAALSVISVLLAEDPQAATAAKNRSQALSKSHFQFSLALYRGLTDTLDEGDNFVYSPYCVNLALSMMFLGTRSASPTSNQFRQVLGYEGMSYVDVHTAFKAVTDNFGQTYYQKKVRSASALFVPKGTALSPTYSRAVREFYRSNVEEMDFRGAPADRSAAAIDEWVSEVGEGQLPQLDLPQLSADTSLLFVNFLAMQSKWLHPFDPMDTFDKGLFFLPGNKRMEVPMMSGVFDVPTGYSSELECRVLEIPFTQKRMSMFIFLPDDPENGIYRLQNNATAKNVKTLLSTLQSERVTVRLPRFRVTSDLSDNLDSALKTLGLVDVYRPDQADLSLMSATTGQGEDRQRRLSLSSINHAASYQVTESSRRRQLRPSGGTRKQSSSGSGLGDKVFEVDHPFMFLVWDYYSGMILLMGRVLHPEQPPVQNQFS